MVFSMASVAFVESISGIGDLLDRVAQGETITLVRAGEPIAILHPTGETDASARCAAINDLVAFGRGRKLNGLTIRQLVDEGRRF